MSSPKKNEAVQDAVVHVRGKSANNGAHGTASPPRIPRSAAVVEGFALAARPAPRLR